jgi:hypothetical protein
MLVGAVLRSPLFWGFGVLRLPGFAVFADGFDWFNLQILASCFIKCSQVIPVIMVDQ